LTQTNVVRQRLVTDKGGRVRGEEEKGERIWKGGGGTGGGKRNRKLYFGTMLN